MAFWSACTDNSTCVSENECICIDCDTVYAPQSKVDLCQDWVDLHPDSTLFDSSFTHRCVRTQLSGLRATVGCNRYDALCDKTVTQIVFPGTFRSGMNNDQVDWSLDTVDKDCARVHQTLSIEAQLENGIRFLDIPMGIDGDTVVRTFDNGAGGVDSTDEWRGGATLTDIVSAVLDFVSDYRNDLVVLDVSALQPSVVFVDYNLSISATDSTTTTDADIATSSDTVVTYRPGEQPTPSTDISKKIRDEIAAVFQSSEDRLLPASEWKQPKSSIKDLLSQGKQITIFAPSSLDFSGTNLEGLVVDRDSYLTDMTSTLKERESTFPNLNDLATAAVDVCGTTIRPFLRVDWHTTLSTTSCRALEAALFSLATESGSTSSSASSWVYPMSECHVARQQRKLSASAVVVDQFHVMSPNVVELAAVLNGNPEPSAEVTDWLFIFLLIIFILCGVTFVVYFVKRKNDNDKKLEDETPLLSEKPTLEEEAPLLEMEQPVEEEVVAAIVDEIVSEMEDEVVGGDLPDGWSRYIDEEGDGGTYFFNENTGETVWESEVWSENLVDGNKRRYRQNKVFKDIIFVDQFGNQVDEDDPACFVIEDLPNVSPVFEVAADNFPQNLIADQFEEEDNEVYENEAVEVDENALYAEYLGQDEAANGEDEAVYDTSIQTVEPVQPVEEEVDPEIEAQRLLNAYLGEALDDE